MKGRVWMFPGLPALTSTVKVEGEPPREFTAGSQAVAVFQTSEKYFAFEIVKEDPEAALTVELVRGWELPISPRSGRLSSGVEKVTIGGRARSRQVIGLLEGVAYF